MPPCAACPEVSDVESAERLLPQRALAVFGALGPPSDASLPFVIRWLVCDAYVVLPGPAAGISMMGRGHGRHDGPSGKEGGHGE